MWCAHSAAPSAPPASPAAGWIQRRSAIPLRSSLPLATQLSATPPARQRFADPVSFFASVAIASTTRSVTRWIASARSQCSWPISLSASRRGNPKSFSHAGSLAMRRPVA